jgi:hypothetical protein
MKNNNSLGDFIDDYIESTNFIRQSELFDHYQAWYNNQGGMNDSFLGKKNFLKSLKELKIKVIEDKIHGNKIYIEKKK